MPVQKGRVKLCDGDYTIKKEIGNTVSLSANSMFLMQLMSCSIGIWDMLLHYAYFCLLRKAN